MKKKFDLSIHEGYSNCGDGCCSDWFTNITVDGKHVDSRDDDLVEKVLSHVTGIYEGDYDNHEDYLTDLFAACGFEVDVEMSDTVSDDMEIYD